jgi:hypothetical protein
VSKRACRGTCETATDLREVQIIFRYTGRLQQCSEQREKRAFYTGRERDVISRRPDVILRPGAVIPRRWFLIPCQPVVISHRRAVILHRRAVIPHRSVVIPHRSVVIPRHLAVIPHRTALISRRGAVILVFDPPTPSRGIHRSHCGMRCRLGLDQRTENLQSCARPADC